MKTIVRIIIVILGLGISAMANPPQPTTTTDAVLANDTTVTPNDQKHGNRDSQNQVTEDNQQNNAFFGKPGSTKRWCWYIGAGVVVVITATAIYLYYRGKPAPQPTNNPVVVQPQPTNTNPADQASSTLTATPPQTIPPHTTTTPPSPTQPSPIPQPISGMGQTNIDTHSEPGEENWGDFDTSAAINAVRQGMVLTDEDERTIENDLEASRKQAVSVEIEGLRKRRFRTLHHPRGHQVSQSLDLHRMPSPESIDPTMAKALKKLSLQTI